MRTTLQKLAFISICIYIWRYSIIGPPPPTDPLYGPGGQIDPPPPILGVLSPKKQVLGPLGTSRRGRWAIFRSFWVLFWGLFWGYFRDRVRLPSAARRTKASQSEADGGVYPSWGGQLAGEGQLALCGARSALVYTCWGGHCRLAGST